MIRKIIKIDEETCNGCGICAEACHEGAIGMIDGKAKLLRDDYCDGLGDCLPACPVGAISFEVREALAYDEAAVKKAQADKQAPACGCPGSQSKAIIRSQAAEASQENHVKLQSRLAQWPVQIQLLPVNAPYLDGANILIAADCTAYAYADFHNDFIKNKITLIGCPKLDHTDYAEKLTQIIANNSIRSITVVRMEVPCCGGIEHAVKKALMDSQTLIPWSVVTISTDGSIIEER